MCSVGFVFSRRASRKPSVCSWRTLCLEGLCSQLPWLLRILPFSRGHLLQEASADTLSLGAILSVHCLLNPGPTSILALNSKNGTKFLLTRVVSVFTPMLAHGGQVEGARCYLN